jgi:Lrp/AsnC family leucine-responsive transcriptional regulator
MKLANGIPDDTDRRILRLLQRDCKISLAKIGEAVGMSAPSVVERIRKLEQHGVITGYHAAVDARRVGLDVTAFIGVSISHPRLIRAFERRIDSMDGVLECHHVTGVYTLLVKAKTYDTAALEALISKVRSIAGVARTETMVVLSTHCEHMQVCLEEPPARTRQAVGPNGSEKTRRTVRAATRARAEELS